MIFMFMKRQIKMFSLRLSKPFLASSIANVFCDTAFVFTNGIDFGQSDTKTRQKKVIIIFTADFALSLGRPAPASAFFSDRAIST